jgi:hypothetical protein
MAAWGYNFSGQLGNNSPFNSSVPVAVSGGGLLAGKVVTSVAAGHGHSLARCADGSVAVWGANGSGQLGNRSTSGTWVPQAVDSSGVLAGKAVAVIAGGENHTLALASWWHASSSDPYTQWLLDSLSESAMADPAMTGEAAAPAGDGISNLMKFALGLRPLDDGTASLPVTGMAEGYLTLTYRQSKQATDVTYTVEAGDALAAGSWAPATQVLSQSDAGDHWLVTVRDLVPMAGHPRRFMRLQVSR